MKTLIVTLGAIASFSTYADIILSPGEFATCYEPGEAIHCSANFISAGTPEEAPSSYELNRGLVGQILSGDHKICSQRDIRNKFECVAAGNTGPVIQLVDEIFVLEPDFDCLMDDVKHERLKTMSTKDVIDGENSIARSLRECRDRANMMSSSNSSSHRERFRDGGRRHRLDRIELERSRQLYNDLLSRSNPYSSSSDIVCQKEYYELPNTMNCVEKLKSYNPEFANLNEGHYREYPGKKEQRRYSTIKNLCMEQVVSCKSKPQPAQ